MFYGLDFHYNLFKVDRHSVNVLHVSAQCDIPQCKYKRATRKRYQLNNVDVIGSIM